MSETLTTAADNVRFLTGDRDPQNYVHDTVQIYQHLIDQAQRLGARAGLGLTWAESGLTFTAGSTADYTFSPVAPEQSLLALFIPSLGRYMYKVSLDEINAMREGITSTNKPQGEPQYFASWESGGQVATFRIDIVPVTTRAVDILWVSGVTTSYTDSATLPFNETFLRVVEKATAAELMVKALPAERERIGFNAEVLPLWASQIDEGIAVEWERLARIGRSPYGVGAILGS